MFVLVETSDVGEPKFAKIYSSQEEALKDAMQMAKEKGSSPETVQEEFGTFYSDSPHDVSGVWVIEATERAIKCNASKF